MLDIDPKLISFRDVRLNTAYTSTFTIANPLTVAVEFSLKTSNSRYTVNPTNVMLQPNQSMVITVRLFLSNFSNISRGIRGQDDHISIKSAYFEQKVDLIFYLREYRDSSSKSPLRTNSAGSNSSVGGGINPRNATPIRSASPNQGRMSLADQLQLKNEIIARLEEENILLQSKYPNMQDVVRSRIEQERIQFEEKSEKILLLLKKKDETIASLQSDLDNASTKISALTTIRSQYEKEGNRLDKDDSKSIYRENRNPNPASDSSRSSRYGSDAKGSSPSPYDSDSPLELEVQKLRIDFQNEIIAHNSTAEKLQYFQNDNLSFRTKIQGYEQKLAELTNPRLDEKISLNRYQQEIRGLSEKNADQSEQIEVLVSELSKLRSSSYSKQGLERELQVANDQNANLRKDLTMQSAKYAELRRSYELLEKKSSEQQENDAKLIFHLQNCVKELETVADPHNYNSSSSRSSKKNAERELFQDIGQALHSGLDRRDLADDSDNLYMDDRRKYELNVEGTLGVATPNKYLSRSLANKDQMVKDRSAKAEIYLEQVERLQSENSRLREALADSNTSEEQLRSKIADIESRNSCVEDETKSLREKLDRIRHERQELQKQLDLKDLDLKANIDKTNAIQGRAENQDANVWWSYIWTEMKKFRQPGEQLIIASDGGDSFDSSDIVKLRDIIRRQGIELVISRQENLAKRLSSKKEMTNVREQLEESNKEVVRLSSQLKGSRSDKDIKISELESSIKTLAGKSDLHAAAVSIRHELETERLTIHHLRSEIESYKDMLDMENARLVAARKEIGGLHATLDSVEVVNTISNVPGVDPSTLIEIMGIQMVSLQSDLVRAKSSISHYHSQVESLQCTLSNKIYRKASEDKRASTSRTSADMGAATTSSSSERGKHARGRSPARSRSPSPLPVGSSTPANLASRNFDFADEFGGESDESGILNLDSNVHLLSVMVDDESTPQKVMDTLDAALLTQRLQQQELSNADLRTRIRDLEDEIVRLEKDQNDEMDSLGEGSRFEYTASKRRVEILQTSLDESKGEAEKLRAKNLEFENKIIDLESSLQENNLLGKRDKRALADYSNQSILSDESSTMIYENSQTEVLNAMEREEFEKMKISVKEKTAHLKILMETLDTLQSSNVENQNIFSPTAASAEILLSNLAAAPLPALDSPWVTRALVKRIVDLTSELTSKASQYSLLERQVTFLEHENSKKMKQINAYKSRSTSNEIAVDKMTSYIESLSKQLRDSEKFRLTSVTKLKSENESIMASLKESELQISTQEITIQDLKNNLEQNDRTDFTAWFDDLLLEHHKAKTLGSSTSSSANSSNGSYGVQLDSSNEGNNNKVPSAGSQQGDISSVYSLVLNLVEQWRSQVGPYVAARAPTTKISKTEKKFLQKCANLVTVSHEKCLNSIQIAQEAEEEKRRNDIKLIVLSDRLKIALKHLHRYRKRAIASEAALTSNREADLMKTGKLVGMLKRSLRDYRVECENVMAELINEKREKRLVECKLAADSVQLKKLHTKISELESRGNADIRGRDAAAAEFEKKIKIMEDSMQKWVDSELPRIVAGLPVTEEYSSQKVNDQFDTNEFGSSSSSFHPNLFERGLGGDKTYALTQALCASKSLQLAQDIRYNSLSEKLSILKEKYIKLEGLLERNKAIFESEDSKFVVKDHDGQIIQDSLESKIYEITSCEILLNEKLKKISARVVELEEDNIDLNGKLTFATKHSEDMKALVDVILKDEQDFKVKTSEHITKARLDLENTHGKELKQLRESYEAEKRAMNDELDRLSNALEEVRYSASAAAAIVAINDPHTSGKYEDNFSHIDNDSDSSTGNRRGGVSVIGGGSRGGSPKQGRSNDNGSFVDIRQLETARSELINLQQLLDNEKQSSSNLHRLLGNERQSLHSAQVLLDIEKQNSSNIQRLLDLEKLNVKRIQMEKDKALAADNSQAGTVRGSSDQDDAHSYEILKLNENINQLNHINSSNNHYIEELKVELGKVQRLLEGERQLYGQVRAENEELSQLLKIQRETFTKHIDTTAAQISNSLSNSGNLNISQDVGDVDGYNTSSDDMENAYHAGDGRFSLSANALFDEIQSTLLSGSEMFTSKPFQSFISSIRSLVRKVRKSVIKEHEDELRAYSTNVEFLNMSKGRDDGSNLNSKGGSPFGFDVQETRQTVAPATSSSSIGSSSGTSFKALMNRLKYLEDEFTKSRLSERHIFFLKDFKIRIQEIEQGILDEISSYKRQIEVEKQAKKSDRDSFDIRAAEWNAQKEASLRLDTEKTVKFDSEKKSWDEEKMSLLNKVRALEDEIVEARQSGNKTLVSETLKSRYEEANKNLQDALDMQSASAGEEIGRLEELLQRTQLQLKALSNQNFLNSYGQEFSKRNTSVSNGGLEEVAKLQQMVNSLSDELDSTRSQLDQAKNRLNETEVQLLKENMEIKESFSRYRNQQDGIIRDLQSNGYFNSISSRGDLNATLNTDGAQAPGMRRADYESEDKLRKLEYKYRSKSAELEALTRAMQKAANSSALSGNNVNASNDSDSISLAESSINDKGYIGDILHSVPREYRNDLYEARIASAEHEIESLSRSLAMERQTTFDLMNRLSSYANIKHEQQDTSDVVVASNIHSSIDAFLQSSAQDFQLPEEVTKEKVRLLVKKMNDFKKHARTEMHSLKDYVILHEGVELKQQKFNLILKTISENQSQLQALREDNFRKSKLLTALKEAKNSNSNALGQWQVEAKEHEETVKRLHRAIASKDAMVRDLRSKVLSLEENMEKLGVSDVHDVSASADMANLLPNDLRSRLKASESERGRLRTRINALKDKVTDLENETKTLKEDNETLKKTCEKLDHYKSALTKKDSVVKSLRSQIDDYQSNFEELAASNNKGGEGGGKEVSSGSSTRQLIREIESKDIIIQNLERDLQLMNLRYNSSRAQEENKVNRDFVQSMDLPAALRSNSVEINDIMNSLANSRSYESKYSASSLSSASSTSSH